MRALLVAVALLLPLAASAQEGGCREGEGDLVDIALEFAENLVLRDIVGFDDPMCVWAGNADFVCVDQGIAYPQWLLTLEFPQPRVATGRMYREDVTCEVVVFAVGCARGAEYHGENICQ
jgi:hypothetical protein